MLEIEYNDETGELSENQIQQILELLTLAAEMENITEESELSLTFVTNEKIHQINKEYRGVDRPTDVISFALEESVEEEIEIIGAPSMPRILGDIIISIPKAKEQAMEYGHSFMRELGFLAVHGFLHLLGYDHGTKEEEKEMFTKQEKILTQFGLSR
ncbi:rRNA maturation RNase YbeY [Caldibacillus thermolactis]|uniref:Endoribonuclease YbeY n=1 Tax=Pallidibacillus thermolactis TaxID=251051 RepID=A0ABT2WBZ0_9BACI|nr:rRNA maturation RNase YbeY [Pallidibacillus thermolactis]MCU9592976.1 rRNA maturation RNase YbeY [Pallidibacillus thermolactis]MCU9600555.1 rRNA maturation RNase YbeY [Pallidibacillus thermolactis subsp. kokeshiiformis]MED1674354.1 rRNA maturation RNase YbeY [Pallidibacillus thermolactis subsp. kokeshiiformis]